MPFEASIMRSVALSAAVGLLSVAGCAPDSPAEGQGSGTPTIDGESSEEPLPPQTEPEPADVTPPTWPPDAVVLESYHEILYDSPASTEAELRQRDREHGVGLDWPAATDDSPAGVAYYLLMDGDAELARVTDETRYSWTATTERGTTTIIAVDAAGNRSEPLTATWERMQLDVFGPGGGQGVFGGNTIYGGDSMDGVFGGDMDADILQLLGGGELGSNSGLGGLGMPSATDGSGDPP